MCLAEKQTNTNFIVFSFTQAGLDPTIYHTHGEHVNRHNILVTEILLKTKNNNDPKAVSG